MARQRSTKRKKRAENLTLFDSAGRPRIFVGYVGEGDQEAATLHLSDAKCRPRAVIQVAPAGHSAMSILDADGWGKLGMAVGEDGEVSVGMNRPPGVPVVRIRWTVEGGLQIEVWGQSEPPVVHHVQVPT